MPPRRTIIFGAALFSLLLALGGALVLFGDATGGMSRYIYVTIDLPAFVVLVILSALLAAGAALVPVSRVATAGPAPLLAVLRPWHLGVFVLALTVAGTHLVYHGYAFSMDEFMTRFQGRIFLSGHLAGRIPDEWRPFGTALLHGFALFDPATGMTASSYRPGMSLLYALFELPGLGLYVSAFMTAGAVVLAAAIARRLWPGDQEAPVIAALLVATSQQAIVGGLTSYAMPAHLFFNLLWLWLFLGDNRAGHFLAPIVGVFTAALHQVHMHAFFATPFLLTLLRPFRWRLVAYYGVVYLIGHLLIVSWDQLAIGGTMQAVSAAEPASAGQSIVDRVLRILRFPGGTEVATVTALIARFFAWQSLALIPLLLFLRYRKDWSPTMVLLGASILLSLAPYPFLMPDQGHGWGYRYLHGLIGNFALLGTAGWIALSRANIPGLRMVIAAALLVSAAIMLPLRAVQVERLVGAYASASEFVEHYDSDVVIVDTFRVYYGTDLVRNDPFLRNRPITLDFRDLPADRIGALCRRYSVAFVGASEIEPLGIPILSPAQISYRRSDYDRLRSRLRAADCFARPRPD